MIDNSITFSSFLNNFESQQCLYSTYYHSPNKYQIKTSNFIENKAKNIILSKGETLIKQTCILNNGNSSFYLSNSKISLYNCTIDNLNQNGIGSFEVFERTNSFVLGLVFIETGSCVNDIYNIGDFIQCQLINMTMTIVFSLKSKSRNNSYIHAYFFSQFQKR